MGDRFDLLNPTNLSINTKLDILRTTGLPVRNILIISFCETTERYTTLLFHKGFTIIPYGLIKTLLGNKDYSFTLSYLANIYFGDIIILNIFPNNPILLWSSALSLMATLY